MDWSKTQPTVSVATALVALLIGIGQAQAQGIAISSDEVGRMTAAIVNGDAAADNAQRAADYARQCARYAGASGAALAEQAANAAATKQAELRQRVVTLNDVETPYLNRLVSVALAAKALEIALDRVVGAGGRLTSESVATLDDVTKKRSFLAQQLPWFDDQQAQTIRSQQTPVQQSRTDDVLAAVQRMLGTTEFLARPASAVEASARTGGGGGGTRGVAGSGGQISGDFFTLLTTALATIRGRSINIIVDIARATKTEWQASLARIEGEIDQSTDPIFVLADDSYAQGAEACAAVATTGFEQEPFAASSGGGVAAAIGGGINPQ